MNTSRRLVSARTWLCLWVSLWLIAATAHAAASPATSSETKNCLWKVSSAQHHIYLLGSLHVLKADHYPLHANIYHALDAVQHVMFEVNMDESSSIDMQAETMQRGFFTNGRTLQTALSPEGYDAVEHRLTARGYTMASLKHVKPWMLAANLTLLELQKLGFDPNRGVDQHLYLRAKQDGKTIDGFETIDEQLRLFDTLAPRTQEQFLLQTLTELDAIEQETAHLIDAWRVGRVSGLERTLERMKTLPEVYQTLIVQRNQRWMPRIESLLHDDAPSLIVVGSLHLVGDDGLLSLLNAKGYRIEQR